jgi:hypothetical protein
MSDVEIGYKQYIKNIWMMLKWDMQVRFLKLGAKNVGR